MRGKSRPAFPISIHALREEGDLAVKVKGYFRFPFLSTPSARRATGVTGFSSALRRISIHALREEGDEAARATEQLARISIHALREEGDLRKGLGVQHQRISIHALREEGDNCTTSPTL